MTRSSTPTADVVHPILAESVTNLSEEPFGSGDVQSSAIWPFPSWSLFDPTRVCWDPFGERDICIFLEEKSSADNTRLMLYSAVSPAPGIYRVEDQAELDSPPEIPGAPVSGDELWPRAEPGWLRYAGPMIWNYDPKPGPTWAKELDDCNATKEELLAEIQAFERLRASPHPHIAEYHGCIIEDGCAWASGVVLKRYPTRLADAASARAFTAGERARIIAEISAALSHLHALGLAHNDVSPWNIMLDHDMHAMLIDLGACLPFGQYIPAIRGTPGFCTDNWTTSDPAHDTYGLEAIRRYLDQASATDTSAVAANPSISVPSVISE
ncbi:kinase-like domain-containing protein [Auriculariales sp. MPI-PUGE-AT-0066]|nr:kinase-like domain-containing protein [Auriculariales sp. MPI-PUGE-AT-0066]